jgi:3-phenylpropionate/cinnamic acid dioxygenase small subunit
MSASLADRAAALVHHEARLLDERRYDEWVAMFAPDARYWMPVSPDMTSPTEGPSHFHDDIQVMRARVHRLANPRAFGAEPPPRTAHMVSGITVDTLDDAIVVGSSQLMLEYRDRGNYEADQRLFGGRVTHRLRADGDRLLIARKRIDLINAEGSFNAVLAPF